MKNARIRLEPTAFGYRWSFPAMGTLWEIQVSGPSEKEAIELVGATVRWCMGFEQRYSRFKPESWLSQVNANAGSGTWMPLTPSDNELIDAAREAHFLSEGLVDATAQPLVALWDYRRPEPRPPGEAAIDQALQLVGLDKIETRAGGIRLPLPGMGLDFGGFAKELAVDRLGQILSEAHCAAALVNGGGDIVAFGRPTDDSAWAIGLESPDAAGTCWGGVEIVDHAVATSGGYQRYFTYQNRRYSHLVDPRSGRSAACEVEAASIIAPTCFQAGVTASAACLLPLGEAKAMVDATPLTEGCLHANGRRIFSHGFSSHATSRQTAVIL